MCFLLPIFQKGVHMRNESDLAGVKSVAKMLLMATVTKTDYSPMVVQHPFTNTGIIGIPSENGESLEIIDITAGQENLSRWRCVLEKQIDNASDPFQIYMMVNNPYGLTFLKFAEPYLSQEDFSHILGSAWVMCEAPHNDPNLGVSKLIAMFEKADPALLMDEDEYATYQAMDDTVTVYRGVTPHNAKNLRALSWTTSRETAEWFAHRFGEEGTVYEAQIDKTHIFAYLSDRSEAEVILNPRYLTDITEAEELAIGFSLLQ